MSTNILLITAIGLLVISMILVVVGLYYDKKRERSFEEYLKSLQEWEGFLSKKESDLITFHEALIRLYNRVKECQK